MQPDMNQLLGNLAKMQNEMQKIQAELAKTKIEGSAGNGAVTISATADLEFTGVKIKPEAVDPEDIGMLEDLILTAIKDACTKAKQAGEKQAMQNLGGMLPPGMGF
ncbi:MAG: YbaB/EbfC family nucleoid-associated protein [Cyanobacteria bacterium DS2.3.42]|nr:YbaB/EbfC family nucleoid-associated protein [Cyanobacteria bacterium DS2.3.42]